MGPRHGCPETVRPHGHGSCLAPVNTAAPVISGTTTEGQTLTTSTGTWQGGKYQPASFQYQWQTCSTVCTNVGSNQNTYVPQSSDIGNTIQVSVTATNPAGSTPATSAQVGPITGASPFPLSVSTNGRYLETAGGKPFLMVGDSPQSVNGNLSVTNADAYLDDREEHGFDVVWTNLLCDDYTGCNSNGTTYDDVAPFTSGSSPSSYNIADPNSTYFTRAVEVAEHAEADGIEMFVNPIETGDCLDTGWWGTLENNGNGSTGASNPDYQYGVYVATEFAALNNIVWFMGNDYSCFEDQTPDNNLIAVVNGILSVTPHALISSEIGLSDDSDEGNCSQDDITNDWASVLDLNGCYTYAPAYANLRRGYAQTPTTPAYLAESNYEGQANGGDDGCSTSDPINCRKQAWWTMTSGATGELYGGPCYAMTNSTTLSSCDTTGVSQLEDQTTLLSGIAWYNLSPDTGHTLLYCTSSGTACGSCPTTGSIVSVTCVTDAADSFSSGQATEAVAYLPDPSSFSTVTVNLADFVGSVTARWYDPTNGTFTSISGSPFANSGTHSFTPPGTNSAGDTDWVLVLQSAAGSPP
jgi:hypothetical protein